MKEDTKTKQDPEPQPQVASVEMLLPVVPWYRYTGEFRKAKKGEYYLNPTTGTAVHSYEASLGVHLILEKIEPSGFDLVGKLCAVWDDTEEDAVHMIVRRYDRFDNSYLASDDKWYTHARALTAEEADQYIWKEAPDAT